MVSQTMRAACKPYLVHLHACLIPVMAKPNDDDAVLFLQYSLCDTHSRCASVQTDGNVGRELRAHTHTGMVAAMVFAAGYDLPTKLLDPQHNPCEGVVTDNS